MAERTITSVSNDVIRQRGKQVALTSDTILTEADSGTTFILDAIGEVITLPPVTVKANYTFICSATTATTDWTIVADTDVIFGSAEVSGSSITASAENTITLVVAKFLPGDLVKVQSDGTKWYVSGIVVTILGLTFTAP